MTKLWWVSLIKRRVVGGDGVWVEDGTLNFQIMGSVVEEKKSLIL